MSDSIRIDLGNTPATARLYRAMATLSDDIFSGRVVGLALVRERIDTALAAWDETHTPDPAKAEGSKKLKGGL